MVIMWMVAFAVLVLVELNTMEFTCLSLALGCLLAASMAWLGLALPIQLAVAAVAGGAGVLALAPQLRRHLAPPDQAHGVVGASAVVTEAILPPNEGKVRLDGVTWQAVSNQAIPEGTHVYVSELSGAKLTVLARHELEAPREKE